MNADLGYGGLVLSASSSSISALLRALSAKRTLHVLSRPQITTLDNQTAQMHVGQDVPLITGVDTSDTGSANPQVGEPRPVGIILTVTPRISPDGTIVMEVTAEKSGLSGEIVPIFSDINTGNVIGSPIINVTNARSTLSIPNGQTVVMGGMITKQDNTIQRKVPWLGDIPYLGYAFRYDSTTTKRTELLIFLTPRIIRNDADSEIIKQIESERLHFIERDAERLHGPLYAVPSADATIGTPNPVAPTSIPPYAAGRRTSGLSIQPAASSRFADASGPFSSRSSSRRTETRGSAWDRNPASTKRSPATGRQWDNSWKSAKKTTSGRKINSAAFDTLSTQIALADRLSCEPEATATRVARITLDRNYSPRRH